MKQITTVLLGCIIAIPVWAGDGYDIEAVKQPDRKWSFQDLTACKSDESTRVSGRLRAINRHAFPPGHIDVAAYLPSGELIAETTTGYTSSVHLHRTKKKVRAHFSALLSDILPPGSALKVAFHREEPHPKSSPVHAINIAR